MQAPVSGFARLLAALAAKKAEGAPAEAEAPAA
jgi:large subunit ribosomal protein L10